MATQTGTVDGLPAPAATRPRSPLLARLLRHSSSGLTATASIIGGFVLWEIVARIVNDKLFLVAPSAIVTSFGRLWQAQPSLADDMVASGEEFLLGMLAASVVGIVLGLLLATNKPLRILLSPWVTALNSTPTIVLAPLLILWFGLGLLAHTLVVFFVAVFSVLVNTQTGIENADENLTETARAFGASQRQIFTKVLIPGAIPYIAAGLRLAIARGIVGVVVAELFGAKSGLGFLITTSSQTFDMAALFAAALILAGAGVITSQGAKIAERRIAPWRWA